MNTQDDLIYALSNMRELAEKLEEAEPIIASTLYNYLLENIEGYKEALSETEQIFEEIFADIEKQINNIPGPRKITRKKSKNKLTVKGELEKDFKKVYNQHKNKNNFAKKITFSVAYSFELADFLSKDEDEIIKIIQEELEKNQIDIKDSILAAGVFDIFKNYYEAQRKLEKEVIRIHKESSKRAKKEEKIPLKNEKHNKDKYPKEDNKVRTTEISPEEKIARKFEKLQIRIESLQRKMKEGELKEKNEGELEKILEQIKRSEIDEGVRIDATQQVENLLSNITPPSEDTPEKEKTIKKSREQIDLYENSKSKIFIDFLLSEKGFHHNLSNTKNANIHNSQGDGSFAMKIARPIFVHIRNLAQSGYIDPDNTNWEKIHEAYDNNIEDNKVGVRSFMNILKNHNKQTGSIIEIFSNFYDATKEFSTTNYFNKNNNKESLQSVFNFMENIIFEWNKK